MTWFDPSFSFDPFTFAAVVGVAAWLYRVLDGRISLVEKRTQDRAEKWIPTITAMEARIASLERQINRWLDEHERDREVNSKNESTPR